MSTRSTLHLGENFHAYEELTEEKDALHIGADVFINKIVMRFDIRISEADESGLCDALVARRKWRAKLAAKKGG